MKDEKLSFFESLFATKDADAHQIVKGLYVGTVGAAEDKQAMRKRGISHVLIVHPLLPEKHANDFRYLRLSLLDEPTANLLELLPEALSFLGEARSSGKGTFVHCAKGISRSPSIAIAFMMVDGGLGFEEAWKRCEQKRPVVYPNIGFQMQLRHLEKLMGISGLIGEPSQGITWAEKVQRLKKAVPKGPLEQATLAGNGKSHGLDDASGPRLTIREDIGESMQAALDEVEALVNRTFIQPALLQKREQWKRHGLYFENMHKYEAMPREDAVMERARAVSERLQALPKAFADTLKGVKMATGVATEIDSWLKIAEAKFSKERQQKAAAASMPAKEEASMPAKKAKPKIGGSDGDGEAGNPKEQKKNPQGGAGDIEIPAWVTQGLQPGNKGLEDSSSDEEKKKDKKKKKKDKEAKKLKKEGKKLKKAKKAEKLAAEMQRVAQEAEVAAHAATKLAEEAARRADKVEMDIRMAEAREAEQSKAAEAGGIRDGLRQKKAPERAKEESRSSSSEADSEESGGGRDRKRRRRN